MLLLEIVLETLGQKPPDQQHSKPSSCSHVPSLTWRLGSQLFWLIKHFRSTQDLRPPSGDWRSRAAGASSHPAAVPAA